MKRQSKKDSSHKTSNISNNLPTSLTPKNVDMPKIDKSKKIKENKAKRESIETQLEADFFDPMKGNPRAGITKSIPFTAYDVAVSIRPELYKGVEPKPDRMKNRAVEYMLHHLKLLNILISNMSELYKKKIWESPEFRTLLETHLGTAEYSGKELTKEEKRARLKEANQWLIDSLTIIEDNLSNDFKDILKDTGKPYFKLIKTIAKNQGISEIKIPDRMIR